MDTCWGSLTCCAYWSRTLITRHCTGIHRRQYICKVPNRTQNKWQTTVRAGRPSSSRTSTPRISCFLKSWKWWNYSSNSTIMDLSPAMCYSQPHKYNLPMSQPVLPPSTQLAAAANSPPHLDLLLFWFNLISLHI